MLNNIRDVSTMLKANNYKVFRDTVPKNTDYPYIVYQYINDQPYYASNQLNSKILAYQISLITTGTETDLIDLVRLFKKHNVFYNGFSAGPYKENDDTVTQFNCIVRFKNGIE